MSETDIVWHWHWVNSEVLEFKNFLFSFLFWDLILFELSFFLMLFISWYYVTLSLTRFWHYMTLTLSRSWDCLTLRLSDTDIEWLLKLLSSENFLFSFLFKIWFSWSFHFFLMLFISWYYLTLTRFWHYLTLTLTRSWHFLTLALSDTDIDWVLNILSSEDSLFSFFFFLWFSLSFHSFWDFNFFDIIYFLILPESDIN